MERESMSEKGRANEGIVRKKGEKKSNREGKQKSKLRGEEIAVEEG